jgi:predicted RNase H-like HicB family nuclease
VRGVPDIMTLNAYIEFDQESKMYIGIIPGIRGAHTQAETLDELDRNLREVVELCYEANPDEFRELPKFVGTHLVEVEL